MHFDFCTLFDRNYLFKGLALHESLVDHVEDFTLWILCMDDVVFDILERLDLPSVRLLSLGSFEDEELLAVKESRTPVEYCWTCTPSLPLYLLENESELESITYLDADLFFWSSPEPIFAELGAGSVGIIEHRYAPKWEHLTEDSGIYNVGFMTFKNDERGLTCLRWWRDRCLEWCFHRVEDGKMGDQKYLDDWPSRFDGVVVLRERGAGLAPWNFENYSLTTSDRGIQIDGDPLVFCHFHSLSIIRGGRHFALAYPEYGVTKTSAKILYPDYIRALRRAIAQARSVDAEYSYGMEEGPNRVVRLVRSLPPLRWGFRFLKRFVRSAIAAPSSLLHITDGGRKLT